MGRKNCVFSFTAELDPALLCMRCTVVFRTHHEQKASNPSMTGVRARYFRAERKKTITAVSGGTNADLPVVDNKTTLFILFCNGAVVQYPNQATQLKRRGKVKATSAATKRRIMLSFHPMLLALCMERARSGKVRPDAARCPERCGQLLRSPYVHAVSAHDGALSRQP